MAFSTIWGTNNDLHYAVNRISLVSWDNRVLGLVNHRTRAVNELLPSSLRIVVTRGV